MQGVNPAATSTSNNNTNTPTREGLRLTYDEVASNGPPRPPLAETHGAAIGRAVTNFEGIVVPFDADPFQEEFCLVGADDNPKVAYQLFGKPSKSLDHHGTNWGELQYAVAFPRHGSDPTSGFLSFWAPPPHQAVRVCIKKLNKAVVHAYLAKGGHEDPYKEIARMQELGDGIHVLQCIEALQDDTYLYIITPYCHEGSLLENIPWNEGFHHERARQLFQNILEILVYLEKHGIYHHDIAPDNFLFYNGRLLLFDFAMSLRIPRDDATGSRRYLFQPGGSIYGTIPCQAPEVFFRTANFDGPSADLWSAACILYSMLTGYPLYRLPHPSDLLFRYYILVGGLKPDLNEDVVDVLDDAFVGPNNSEQEHLLARAIANLAIPPDALEVLTGILQLSPSDRWTLQQTIDSPWLQQPPQP